MAGNSKIIGNATVTTNSPSGPITTSIWVQSIQTGTDTQFDENQLKKGISYRPIRRSEMYLNFTAIWSLQNFSLMDNFQEKIRDHYKMIPGGDQTYMTFHYKSPTNYKLPTNNKSSSKTTNLVYNGWIESAEKQFVRFQDVFIRNYRMNILMPLDNFESSQSVGVSSNKQGLITPNNIGFYGPIKNWYNFLPIVNLTAKINNYDSSVAKRLNAATYNYLVSKANAQQAVTQAAINSSNQISQNNGN